MPRLPDGSYIPTKRCISNETIKFTQPTKNVDKHFLQMLNQHFHYYRQHYSKNDDQYFVNQHFSEKLNHKITNIQKNWTYC